MTEKQSNQSEDPVSKRIAKELTSQGDLLPPWQKYPDIPPRTMGWRTGDRASYITAWNKWAEPISREEMIEYFKRYLPIPPAWLGWVGIQCGQDSVMDDMLSGNTNFVGIHWLEQHGLANFSEFKAWYDNTWDKTIGKR